MKVFPEDVFVTGQITAEQLRVLAEQGVGTFINNRPDREVPQQPSSDDLKTTAEELGVRYTHIPMSAGFSPDLIGASVAAYNELPRPIVAFCASGMRSAALWGFGHVEKLGVDGVMDALNSAGFNLEQIRNPLTDFLRSLQG